MANQLIRPDFCGALVTGFVGLHCSFREFSACCEPCSMKFKIYPDRQPNLVGSKNGIACLVSQYEFIFVPMSFLQAFQKLDKEKKRQELEKIRETYGISKDK